MRGVDIEDGIARRIHQQRRLQLLDSKVRPFRVACRGMGTIKAGNVDASDTSLREVN